MTFSVVSGFLGARAFKVDDVELSLPAFRVTILWKMSKESSWSPARAFLVPSFLSLADGALGDR